MSNLNIIPLGGMGKVTQNMYLYQYEKEILIVDCGIGFPDVYMPGVDCIIPDISFLKKLIKDGNKIVGMVLSHGHDDHIGGLGYLLGDLPEFPIYASPLTAGFAENGMEDKGLNKKVIKIDDRDEVKLGDHFAFYSIPVTHSVPDSKHLVIKTPEGLVYHGSDFKLDPKPVDGIKTDFEAIKGLAKGNVLCMLLDCLGSEKSERIQSESTVGPALEKEMASTKGKFIVTLMSSHIHRIQQLVNIAKKYGRKLVFIGMSVENNVEVAESLNKLHIPKGLRINKRNMKDYRNEQLCVIIAGSQGQEGSSLVRAVSGEHRSVKIHPHDKVVFSASVIPGNEIPYYGAIDELAGNDIEVVYPDINPSLHQSGHAGAQEQLQIVELVKPKYVMPIGGEERHRSLFRKNIIQNGNYKKGELLLPETGQIVSFANQEFRIGGSFQSKPKIVDGLGIGDVGPIVLSDRLALGEAGIIVIVVPRRKKRLLLNKITVVSRGFVFMKEADEVIDYIKKKTIKVIKNAHKKTTHAQMRIMIEKRLSKDLYKLTRREPMIVPFMMDI